MTIGLLFTLMFCPTSLSAQKIKTQHQVEKQETLFGIAKTYGVTIEELREVNPAMREPDFVLKKNMLINIPEAKPAAAKPAQTTADTAKPAQTASQAKSAITVGVMLPLHDINGDGKRMVEYYRGMLLAVRKLKAEGFDITMNAWNVAEGDDIRTTLADPKAAQCNVIFGPLYTTQVPGLANFCSSHNIPMVIPFSINGNDVQTCPQIHQVYQTPADITASSISTFVSQFKDYHPVFIDCNDATSKKGSFTFGLRSVLEEKNIVYSITNLNSSNEMFNRSFSTTKKNIVILNTGRSPELGKAFQRLDALKTEMPSVAISMFGYNEWFMYTGVYMEKFRKYDTYIPTVYDYYPESVNVKSIQQQYEVYFKMPVQHALPSFALTGYDHLMFFVRGIQKYGKDFHGTAKQQIYNPVQTPLQFERIGNGGYQNRKFMLIHYK